VTGDPAAGRSDHYSFQVVGYPACVSTEDIFPGINRPGTSDANPNYHRVTDTDIDTEYAADIARAIAAAAWATANS
jgi:leucyl aminopeptidase